MCKYILTYNDVNRTNLESLVKPLFFLNNLFTKAMKLDFIYKMEDRFYHNGELIVTQGRPCKGLMILASGVAEVYTVCEGSEFIIDRLYAGSIINERSFLLDEVNEVNIRCLKSCIVLCRSKRSFQYLLDESP